VDGIYDLFATDDESIAKERAAALQAMLRGNQQASGLAALSGSKAFQPFAQATGQMANQQGDMLAQAGGNRLRMAMQKAEHAEARQARGQEREEDRAFRAQESALTRASMERRDATHKPMQGRPTVRQEDDGTLWSVDPNTNESYPISKPDGTPFRANDRGFETDTAKFGNDIEFLNRMPEDLALLESYADKDVPGMGPIAGYMPGWAISKEGVGTRQAAMRLLNAVIYMSTGKTINPEEAVRQLEARGLGYQSTPEQFTQGVASLKREMQSAAKLFRSKYEPRVIGAVRARGGLKGLEEFIPESPNEKPPQITGGSLGAPLTQTASPAAPDSADARRAAMRAKHGL
jgi:hypothetical protein